ncbi:hypothetical protein CONCODRAFT_12984 [Conidiobolus coronatus NRRL 28638]|uniref:Uncharacterized protein n=1 Tax=Conidiobolus coronatus (strain ATCC 28846 / CBS 209.66 / NRRL 28638) TaxID=796925 RepID=A0A137NRN4_CONC2|nr:hypothetical protein CONCODRAFT_12984 [Conidiobolus coronatus NRRL 28638]|eukprot:KXN65426.1 hypothetical protein CONCODRAFT_12984 [Conidiobolus coronatus NRRL 28638]
MHAPTSESKSHDFLAGNNTHAPVHTPSNTCNTNVKTNRGKNTSFDSSCSSNSIEQDTEAHNGNGRDESGDP